jgi:hypothetical protein
MAYFILLKSLRSLEEFRKNPHVKIPSKSPCANFQSHGTFKNQILFGKEFFSVTFGPAAAHSYFFSSRAPPLPTRLQNSVHYLLPYRKKDQFKAYRVKKDIPRMEMVHHQDVVVELSTRLLTAQHEIQTLRAQLRNTNATI